jgi:hypothetical protein
VAGRLSRRLADVVRGEVPRRAVYPMKYRRGIWASTKATKGPRVADTEAQASFKLPIEADTEPSDALADSLEHLRTKIVGAQAGVKGMSAALRSLRGDTDQVKSAKAQLTAKIAAEKDKISAANLEILKMGTHYDKLAQKQKKATDDKGALTKLREGLKVGGVETQAFTGKWDAVKAMLGDSGPMLGAAAGLGVLGGALVYSTIKISEFALKSADFTRNLQIGAEAMSGSEANAEAMGNQIDRLSNKLSTPKEKLYAMEGQLAKTMVGTRISGQAIEDTFEAVARASDAMGDDVGNSLADIVKRGKMTGRVAINPFELVGTGLPDFGAIAGKLSKNLKIPIEEAKNSLMYGIKADDAAKALLDASIEKYGKVNAKQFLSLDTISAKFHERLVGLVPTGWLDRGLTALDRMSLMFDKSTVTGESLRQLFQLLGTGISDALDNGNGEALVENLVLGAQNATIAFLKFKHAFRDAFNSDTMNGFKLVRDIFVGIGVALAPTTAAFVAVAAAIDQAFKLAKELKGFDLGKQVVGDLTKFLGGGSSPEGTQVLPANASGGTVAATGEGVASVRKGEIILPAGTTRADLGGGRGGSSITVGDLNITVQAHGAKAHEVVSAIKQSLRGEILKVLEDLTRSSGLPTQTTPTS